MLHLNTLLLAWNPHMNECADQFIPERWTTKFHMLRDRRAFAPFSQERLNCVGGNFAIKGIRLVIVMLVKKFKVEFWDDKGASLTS